MKPLKRTPLRPHILSAAIAAAVAATPAGVLAQDATWWTQAAPQGQQEAQAEREAQRAGREAQRAAREAAREAELDAARAAQDADREAMRRAEVQEIYRGAGRPGPNVEVVPTPAVARVPGVHGDWFGQQDGPAVFRMMDAGETKPQTFLGVSTRPLTPEVAAQVGDDLPEGVGLLVAFVEEESPAGKAGLKAHDVLLRFEDQLLINPEQLTVLIRMKKAEEKATLTIVRKGEEQEVEVTLAQREMPVFRALAGFGDQFRVAPVPPAHPAHPALLAPRAMEPLEVEGLMGRLHGLDPAQTERINRQVEEAMRQIEQHAAGEDAQQMREHMKELRRSLEQLHEQRNVLGRVEGMDVDRLKRDALRAARNSIAEGGRVIIANDSWRGQMENNDGEITVRITEDGEEIYAGPFPEPAAVEAMPEEARELIKQLREHLPADAAGAEKADKADEKDKPARTGPTPPVPPTPPTRTRGQVQV